MHVPVSKRVAQIIHETESISMQEKLNLFLNLLEKFGRENVFLFQNISISDKPSYFITLQSIKPIKQKRNLGTWKDKLVYIAPDFNEPLDDLADYM